MSLSPTGYQELSLQLQADLVNHGWGEMLFIVSSTKDGKVKIEINCGRKYVCYIKKEMEFDPEKIL